MFTINSWGTAHRQLANKVFAKIEKQKRINVHPKINLPQLPKESLEWINAARPIVDGMTRDFRVAPFWVPIYRDAHWDIMIVSGRQVFKTTYCTDVLACYATTHPGKQVAYVTHDENALSAFSNQRMRYGTFEPNPLLMAFPRSHLGNVGEISLHNGATIYMLSDSHGYKKVTGKSIKYCVLDEAQYQEVQFLPELEETFTISKGKMRILGVGGEAGSEYHRLWARTNQMEWEYESHGEYKGWKDQDWREGLQFDENGLVVGSYLDSVLKGGWIPTIDEHSDFHGYHIPQTIMPLIPLTEEDAEMKYHIPKKFSLEAKKKNPAYTASVFATQVMGEFYRARRRPLDRATVLACMEPYTYMSLLTPRDVVDLKRAFKEEIVVSMGIDWGSGPSASKTVVAILIAWLRPQRYTLAWIEGRPQENHLDQAQYMLELFKLYGCDIGVADIGYGKDEVKLIQSGGADRRTGEKFEGVGTDKFIGCRLTSNIVKPFQFHQATTDQHGDTIDRLDIDNTALVDEFIDTMEKIIPNKKFPDTETMTYSRPQLMIPFGKEYEVEWLINDFTAITRKDLALVEDIAVVDPRTSPRKEYNHPRDSVVAIALAMQGTNRFDSQKWYWISA